MSKKTYVVLFGWEIEASSIDKARMIAKRNLKPEKDRESISQVSIKKINKGKLI